jgi:hypothetical protein
MYCGKKRKREAELHDRKIETKPPDRIPVRAVGFSTACLFQRRSYFVLKIFFREAPAMPTNPTPKSKILAGSGTGETSVFALRLVLLWWNKAPTLSLKEALNEFLKSVVHLDPTASSTPTKIGTVSTSSKILNSCINFDIGSFSTVGLLLGFQSS